MVKRKRWYQILILLLLTGNTYAQNKLGFQNFTDAIIVTESSLSKHEQAAIAMLIEEVEKRTLVEFTQAVELPAGTVPKIIIGTVASLKQNGRLIGSDVLQMVSKSEAEGYTVKLIKSSGNAPTLIIAGNDSRGMLYGIGYFLRKITMEWDQVLVPEDIDIVTHPSFPLRGHQLGYRPKTNANDGMDEKQWEQYIRDLIVFGTNAIEIMPPITDDVESSPMFPRPQLDMMKRMDDILDKYDIDAWIWFPLMFGDYTKIENEKKSLAESKRIFSNLKRIDAVFIPGGDPGNVHPKVLFSYLQKQTELLHEFHPDAEVWLSPQGFDKSWMDEFFDLLKSKPEWLTGLVYGPQMLMNINDFGARVNGSYPIRRYPDITHTFDSQYAVPNWDFAFGATQNREPINPRPKAQADIFHAADPKHNIGFITYSEGLNDDVNKVIWNGLGWNPNVNVHEILEDYSRYFIGEEYTHVFTQGLYNLEKNWEGSLINNRLVNVHYNMFQQMEKEASPQVRLNWRFQLALYRAYYDTYNRNRLLFETQLEERAYDVLRKAPVVGTLNAISEASRILNEAKLKPVSEDIRARVFELAEALFQSTRMQLSTYKYFATATRRGANLDLIDYSLNNALWLEDQFKKITLLDSEAERLKGIDAVVNWNNPGPGGYYDDLGDLNNQPHVDLGLSYKEDPAFYKTPFVGFSAYERTKNWRVSWQRYMHTLHGFPLKMQYDNLDKTAQYIVKVTYVGDRIKLVANGEHQVHGHFDRKPEMEPLTFELPASATNSGSLTLEWSMESGKGHTGRGCQVAEVWLIKKK